MKKVNYPNALNKKIVSCMVYVTLIFVKFVTTELSKLRVTIFISYYIVTEPFLVLVFLPTA